MRISVLRRLVSRPKLLLYICLLVGGIGVAIWFYNYNQTPTVGVVRPAVTSEPGTESKTTALFRGILIAFEYPADYKTVENKATPLPPVTELYSLNQHDPISGSKAIGITVKNLSVGGMLEDSAYKFRSIETEVYQPSDASTIMAGAKKMTKKDGTEITYFLPGETAYVMIAATSTRPNEAFDVEITELAKSFVWR